jgi:hypothetical protein
MYKELFCSFCLIASETEKGAEEKLDVHHTAGNLIRYN